MLQEDVGKKRKCTRRAKNRDQIRFYCWRELRETTGWQTDAELASLLLSVSSNWSALWFCPVCCARFCWWSCWHSGLNSWKEYDNDHFSLCSVSTVNQRRLELCLIPVIKLMKRVYILQTFTLVFFPVMLFITDWKTSSNLIVIVSDSQMKPNTLHSDHSKMYIRKS